jgi:hypothetical protein
VLVYRSYDYIDFGLAICAGIGTGYLINRLVKRYYPGENAQKAKFGIKASISIAFLIICLATVPLAYNGQEFYGVQDATYEHEFEAMSWVAENMADSHVSTDERLNDIMAPYFDLDCDKTLPWKLKYERSLDSGTVIFMEDKWLSDGAQMSPMEPIKISEDTFTEKLIENDLIYSTGGEGSQIYVVIVR